MYPDIYCLEKYHKKIQTRDYSNVVFIKSCDIAEQKGIPISKGELTCNVCDKNTVYLWNKNDKYYCPQCFANNDKFQCNDCYNPYGCSSCGGQCDVMYKDPIYNRIYCYNNRCLMPFGYAINTFSCDCMSDILSDLKCKMSKDIIQHVLMPFISKYIEYDIDKPISYITLPDLTYIRIDRCIFHQINTKYTIITRANKTRPSHSNSIICNC